MTDDDKVIPRTMTLCWRLIKMPVWVPVTIANKHSKTVSYVPKTITEEALDILGILRSLEWRSPVIMTSDKNLGKILAVKSFTEQHQVTVHSVSFPHVYFDLLQLSFSISLNLTLKLIKNLFCT